MDWLNYHHLRYFWAIAAKGSLRRAALDLHVSAPTISAQLAELEEMLGEPLFRRVGRRLELTEIGQRVYYYAEEIFSLGQELLQVVRGAAHPPSLRFHLGITDSLPKLIAFALLEPIFKMDTPVRVICREGLMNELLPELVAHRLDLILTNEPSPSTAKTMIFSHRLGQCFLEFLVSDKLRPRLRGKFPQNLHGAPVLVPTTETPLRRTLEEWWEGLGIVPRIVAEFDDTALMHEAACAGLGVMPVPQPLARQVKERFQLKSLGAEKSLTESFYALRTERKIQHPAIALLIQKSTATIFKQG